MTNKHDHKHDHSQDHNHKHDHKHDHSNDHDHGHEHNHGSLPVILYIIGLALFIIARVMNNGNISNILYTITVISAGYHVMGEGFLDTIRDTKTNKKFTPNVHLLMGLAAVGAMIIGDFYEGALLIIIFAGAHFLEDYAHDKSRREITKLLNLNPTEGRLILDDGSTKIVPANSLKIGDRVQVLVGDQVPTDGTIIEGKTTIDEAAITGESIPKEKEIGDSVFGSTINGNGSFIMEVSKNPEETVFAKILELVNQSQSNMSQTATKIKKYEPIYVTTILILFPIFILFGNYIMQWGWQEALYRGMVFLTVTSPCALAASDVPATLSAISNLAKQGVLFKGGSYLSNLTEINAVAFDKTGTLTEGKPVVTDVNFDASVSEEQKQSYINLLVTMEKHSNHPLANAIINHFDATEDFKIDVENIIGTGLVATHEGAQYTIGKPQVFNNVSKENQDVTDKHASEGKTVVYFGTQDKVLMIISIMDIPNENSKRVIEYLNSQGIKTVMITGDAKLTGEAVGKQLGISKVMAEVHPEDKANIIRDLQKEYGIVAMLGDGVNDAPALVNADIGVAMGDGTDIAIDVADAVLMKNDLDRFVYAHKVSSKLKRVVWQNIYFSMFVVVLLVVLNILGQMSLPLGVIFHEGSTILVLLNGLRLLKKVNK